MTIGIICAAVLGVIALYQTWAASNYREAALLYREAAHRGVEMLEARKKRIEAVGVALTRMQEAAQRNDPPALLLAIQDGINAVHGTDAERAALP